MHRRPLGSGRRLAFLAALLLVVGCVLPWYRVGGDGGLSPLVYRAFDGTGILAFLAGLATLALIALPYAAGDRPTGVDRWIVFAVLAGAAIVGVLLWIPNVIEAPEGILPDRAYGFWITVVGAILLARSAYDIALEPPRR
jgi:hypothetical protein